MSAPAAISATTTGQVCWQKRLLLLLLLRQEHHAAAAVRSRHSDPGGNSMDIFDHC
jgi:hypothetical protein